MLYHAVYIPFVSRIIIFSNPVRAEALLATVISFIRFFQSSYFNRRAETIRHCYFTLPGSWYITKCSLVNLISPWCKIKFPWRGSPSDAEILKPVKFCSASVPTFFLSIPLQFSPEKLLLYKTMRKTNKEAFTSASQIQLYEKNFYLGKRRAAPRSQIVLAGGVQCKLERVIVNILKITLF